MTGLKKAEAADPALMLAFLRDKAGTRKLRLFACACCRLVWDLLADGPGRARVEAAEHAADALAAEDGEAAGGAAAVRAADGEARLRAEVAAIYCGDGDPFVAALAASALVARADHLRAGRTAQAALLADLFGKPSRPFDPRWRTPEVRALAADAYGRRHFHDLPRVAGLLEHAGCDDPRLLHHCRSGGPHARGCWALDLLMGRD